MYMWGASGFPQVLLRAVMSKKAQHFSVEYVASWALPMILNHQEFFLFFPLKATGCLASLCAKKSTRIYHSVIGREDKRSLVACFDIWYEGIPSIMIFFLVFLGPQEKPLYHTRAGKGPSFPCRMPAGYLVWVVFLCQVNQSPSGRSACLRLNFTHTFLYTFSSTKDWTLISIFLCFQ